jgi:hypothetical protein
MTLYPSIAAKMRREVLDVCGNNVPTHEEIRKLKYGELPFHVVAFYLITLFR